eukprot:TRINITY_DN1357_c1_g1_i1.p1 TRINITY_DN1357_c1_g1~~TRINITY_DN1357_c1_g1_i1.p1  ORF type:complete len:441 (+),score=131.75 TRINITY_DN1357_c1_g1_i1:73-1323(+)
MSKVIILVGGTKKGSMYRPMSLETPTPLVCVAGKPMIYHHLEACKAQLKNIIEVLLIGFYDPSEFTSFIDQYSSELDLNIRYLQEERALGTAGGINFFKDDLLQNDPETFVLFHCDIACEFPLVELLDLHKSHGGSITIMAHRVDKESARFFGGLVVDDSTSEVVHYAEKSKLVNTNLINCGIYAFDPNIFELINKLQEEQADSKSINPSSALLSNDPEFLRLEQDVLFALSGTQQVYAYITESFWMQIKTAGAALAASDLYLSKMKESHPESLAVSSQDQEGEEVVVGVQVDCSIKGNCVISSSAKIDPSAVIGPNACIGDNCVIGKGARLRNCVVGADSVVEDRAIVQHAVVGSQSLVGKWARVEGSNTGVSTTKEGVTITGAGVIIDPELIILDCIVLEGKHITSSLKGEIVL